MDTVDVVILGAGAAGMFAAIEAGRRGRSVLVLDHARAPGEKIRISGGGRCNFTNLFAAPDRYLSQNRRFCISALKRYTAGDFIARVKKRGIAFHEKTLGQLFCDGSATEIVAMLTDEMAEANVRLSLATSVEKVEREGDGFVVTHSGGRVRASSLIVATGGKSIPKMGATGLAYRLAEQFGLRVTELRPGLVPLTFGDALKEAMTPLSGVSVDGVVAHGKTRFAEAVLFTHRGLSGPAILQISSYWREGDEIVLTLAPGTDIFELLKAARSENGRQAVRTVLSSTLPKRLAVMVEETTGTGGNIADLGDKRLRAIDAAVNAWRIKPTGSEGYRTAEVTVGGIDTRDLNSATMEAKAVPGLYFIGEAVDVTGWLGGYNFQWAWSSGWAAGQVA
ncbi:MAG: aminoacetone oxidase family FAD-binding enzyme [Hyphomicrobiales bacterium]|nr:MAG: aminoacetone oxidase family FAD-binding enzyme [Hyphomicrobiales bacterium]